VGTLSLPDGSSTERYEFVHTLYRQVLDNRQLPGRRARLHRLIAERLESLYAQRLEEVVPELAYHFEQAADWPRAIEYLQRSADIAGRRHARRQAETILARALELVSHLSDAQRAYMEPQLLDTLAAHRMAALDMRAIETLETLAARAAESGVVDLQVRALLDQSFLLLWINAERCLEAAQRALYLSAEQVPAMRTRTSTTCVFQRIVVRGWNARDALEFREGLAEIVNIHRVPARAYELLEDSFIRWISGEYREGLRLALEARAKLLEPEANPNLSFFERAGALFVGGWGEALKEYAALAPLNLIFLGEWGQALKELALAIAQAQKNANYHYTLLLRVCEAWLHLHALNFEGVLAICESVLPQMRDPALRTRPGRPAAYAMQLRTALVCSGSASVALGDYARALDDFSTVADDMEHQMVFLDWYWRMPLAAGLTELWLAKGDLTRARLEAERFLDLSLGTAERTWHGLAWEANARVALTNGDRTRARKCIEEAICVVEGFEVPLATWRVHATAARIEEESGNSEPARSHREISRATILGLANSLPEEEPLRKIFLSAPAVAEVLNRDS
jgi:hypothetical protein